MGATRDGFKELIAVQDGYRESEQSWHEVLMDLKARGPENLLDHIDTNRRAVCERQRIATRTVRDGKTYQLLPARTRRNAR